MMTRRERLMATLQGRAVDRPAVNFYEVGGFAVDPADPDPFNVYNDPSWRPLLQLAEERTDLVRMRSAVRARSWDPQTAAGECGVRNAGCGISAKPESEIRNLKSEITPTSGLRADLVRIDHCMEGEWQCTRVTVRIGGRTLSSMRRRSPAADTVWTTEHLVKSVDDLQAYLQLPDEFFAEEINTAALIGEDEKLGDRGIIMVDTEDPICAAASLFSMEDFVVVAMTEQTLFHRLLERLSPFLLARTERVSAEFPGHLWRVYGPEYAAEPFLPPHLFREYVVRYTRPMVKAIQKHGGFARVHCHGRLRAILDDIVAMGADATDPIEPPPQGDVELDDVRRKYGDRLVLFGNIELRDIELMDPADFRKVVERTLIAGTRGPGRGFVLMPSSAPNGRHISPRILKNYETMVGLAETFRP
jgi:hypothetical protein